MKDCFKSSDGYWAEEHGIIPNDETSKCLHNLAVIEWKLANNGQLDDDAKEKMKDNALNHANQAKHMKARLYGEIMAQNITESPRISCFLRNKMLHEQGPR